jgi:hypothetical protein
VDSIRRVCADRCDGATLHRHDGPAAAIAPAKLQQSKPAGRYLDEHLPDWIDNFVRVGRTFGLDRSRAGEP